MRFGLVSAGLESGEEGATVSRLRSRFEASVVRSTIYAEANTASAVAESAIIRAYEYIPSPSFVQFYYTLSDVDPHLKLYFNQSLHLQLQERQRDRRRSLTLAELKVPRIRESTCA